MLVQPRTGKDAVDRFAADEELEHRGLGLAAVQIGPGSC
jgi:hypothetical protein